MSYHHFPNYFLQVFNFPLVRIFAVKHGVHFVFVAFQALVNGSDIATAYEIVFVCDWSLVRVFLPEIVPA